MSRTRSALGGLCSFVNVHGEESLRRRVGPERSQVERQTIRMYERQEEAWRPLTRLTRQRVAAFIRLFLLCMVYVENGRGHPHPVTAKLLKKTLVNTSSPSSTVTWSGRWTSPCGPSPWNNLRNWTITWLPISQQSTWATVGGTLVIFTKK